MEEPDGCSKDIFDADVVGKLTVFNIKGNQFRLMAESNYVFGRVTSGTYCRTPNMTGEDGKTTVVRVDYASLLTGALPAVIRSEAENGRHIVLLEGLDRKGSRISAAEPRMAELLTLLIEDFEEKHYALQAATPVDVLKERMLASNLKQKDLLELPASSRRLPGENASSLPNTSDSLSRRFHVSPEIFS